MEGYGTSLLTMSLSTTRVLLLLVSLDHLPGRGPGQLTRLFIETKLMAVGMIYQQMVISRAILSK